MRRGSNDEPSRIDVQKIIAGTLLAILVIGGVAFYLNRPTHRVEHLSQLIRQTRPWCSSYHLTDQHTDTSRASLVALAHSGSPHWETSGTSAVAFCSKSPKSAMRLVILIFPTSDDENQWLTSDTTAQYEIIGDSYPLPVFVGLGWVAVLGWNGNREARALTSLSRALKTDYRFSQFGTVSW